MTENRAFPESQIDSLRLSMLALSTICKDLSLDPQLVEKSRQLSSQLSSPLAEQRPALTLDVSPEVLAQAKASLNLLEVTGSLARQEGGDLPSHLRSALNDLERELGKELRKEVSSRVYGLYVIIDPEVTGGRDPIEVARGALRGGARMLQLRDKLREKGQTLPLARALKELCSEYNANRGT